MRVHVNLIGCPFLIYSLFCSVVFEIVLKYSSDNVIGIFDAFFM